MGDFFMSNDARKIQRFLDSKFANRQVTLDEIIATEQATLRYFPNPIISIMEDMLKRAKPEKLANYASFSYHLPALRRITSIRSEASRMLVGWDKFDTIFALLQNKFLVVDYNHDTLLCIIDIAKGYETGNWSYNIVGKAIITATASGVRSPQYVMAILQKAYAEKQAIVTRAEEIVKSAQPAVAKKSEGISFIEQMSVQAMWNERQENDELEKKCRRFMK